MGLAQMSKELSKTLSYVLRHAAQKEGIPIRDDGYITFKDLLAHPLFQNYTLPDFLAVIESSDKKRFEIDASRTMIRAAQGHSMKLDGFIMEPIENPALYPIVIHGTYTKFLPSIMENGLFRMSRVHIHMATALPEHGVISGMRSSADVIIYIDLQKAMQDGIKFYRSSNGVILTEGIDGILSPAYFRSVTDRIGKVIE